MARFVTECRKLEPFPGHEIAELPGGIEWRNEAEFIRHGIPVSPRHQASLQDIADELDVNTPFDQYENTRFGAGS